MTENFWEDEETPPTGINPAAGKVTEVEEEFDISKGKGEEYTKTILHDVPLEDAIEGRYEMSAEDKDRQIKEIREARAFVDEFLKIHREDVESNMAEIILQFHEANYPSPEDLKAAGYFDGDPFNSQQWLLILQMKNWLRFLQRMIREHDGLIKKLIAQQGKQRGKY